MTYRKLLALFLTLAVLLCGCTVPAEVEATVPSTTLSYTDGLTVRFIDVGQADCALLECEGEYMLIDGGNVDDGQLVVSYLEQQGVEELSYLVCTHAHEDHVGGLASVLAVYPTERIFSPTTTYSSGCFDNFMHYADQQGVEVEIPQPGDAWSLGSAQVTVLGPVQSYADPNDTSIVLRVELGDIAFLFTGDMETTAENDMLDYWEDRGQGDIVDADVLKVGHHGSNTSTGYRFLYQVDPDYGVISVGAGNSYGHPHDEPMSRLKQAGVTCLRTDELGHITAVTDGTTVRFTWEDQSAQPEDVEPAGELTYIGNKNSLKFHSPDCSSLPAEKNRVEFDSYEAAIEAGYTPCGSCLG